MIPSDSKTPKSKLHKPAEPDKRAEKREPKKHAERLHADMPFDEFVARIVRVKPPVKK